MTRRKSHAPQDSASLDQIPNPILDSAEHSFLSTSGIGENEQSELDSTQSSVADDSDMSVMAAKPAEMPITASEVQEEARRLLAGTTQALHGHPPCRILDPRAIETCRRRRDGLDGDTIAGPATAPVTQFFWNERIRKADADMTVRRKSDGGRHTAPRPLKSPRRKVSSVRLSLTLDGKAEVTEGSGPLSALLPRFKARPSVGLQRSQSAVEPKQKACDSFLLPSLGNVGRGRAGRSRDARTWEFFCDGGDAQDALTKRAEGEQAGSAASAISLIRQNSSSTLKLNATKRNAAREREESCKRTKRLEVNERRRLSRTQSSVARLQSSISEKPSTKSLPGSILDPWASGDSDKENWLPGTTVAPPRRTAAAPQGTGTVRGILRESTHLPSHSSSLDALLNAAKNTPKQQEKSRKVPGTETSDDTTSSSQDAEDFDCVQSLLSLSQGAWQ